MLLKQDSRSSGLISSVLMLMIVFLSRRFVYPQIHSTQSIQILTVFDDSLAAVSVSFISRFECMGMLVVM